MISRNMNCWNELKIKQLLITFIKGGMSNFLMRYSDCFHEYFKFLLPLRLGELHRNPLVMVHIGSGENLVP